MLRRITIFGMLAVLALAALAATTPSVIRRFSGDILVEGEVYGLADLWFDQTNSVKAALTNHTHDASRIVSGVMVPARLGSGTPSSTTFLRGDSTWAELSGGGDADTLNGQAGSWYLARSNHTGTQVLATISDAGTAAARNVPASGNAGATEAVLGNDTRLSDARTPTSHNHAGADITSGTVGTARLGSGTPSSSTFLRGDGTWAELSGGGDADTLNGQAGSWYLARSNHTGSQVLATISDAGTAAARNVPSSGNAGATEAVLGNDTRLSDSRTPTSHAHDSVDITSGTIAPARLGSGAGSTKVLTGSSTWVQLTTEWIANITDHGRDIVESIDPATSRSVIGAAAASHAHAGADITSGTVGTARLGSGTASSATFLRGDGQWAALSGDNLPAWQVYGADEKTDTNTDTTWRSVRPTVRSGLTYTIPANTLATGRILKIEMAGYFDFGVDTDHQPELRLVFDGPTGTDYTVTWHASEPGSSVASQGCMWEARVYLLVETAGSSATVRTRAVMEYEDGSGIFSATYGPGYGYRCTGSAANTLDTTSANELKLEYRGMDSSVVDFRVSALLVWIF